MRDPTPGLVENSLWSSLPLSAGYQDPSRISNPLHHRKPKPPTHNVKPPSALMAAPVQPSAGPYNIPYTSVNPNPEPSTKTPPPSPPLPSLPLPPLPSPPFPALPHFQDEPCRMEGFPSYGPGHQEHLSGVRELVLDILGGLLLWGVRV